MLEETLISKSTSYTEILNLANNIAEYNHKTRGAVNDLANKIIEIHGRGDWVGYTLTHSKKSDLLANIKSIALRLFEDAELKYKELLEKKAEIKVSPDKAIYEAIDNGDAVFKGEGEWFKDSAYQVYEYENKFYAIIVYDSESKWVLDNSLREITEQEINQYIIL